jgi:cell division GTPase FtsZ
MKNEIIEKLNSLVNEIVDLEEISLQSVELSDTKTLNTMIGKKVIIRTYSAGVHFGTLVEKAGNEVILKNARRLYYWVTANGGLSLSEVAKFGVKSTSKICTSVDLIWLEAIEIIPCTKQSIENIEIQNDFIA